VKTLPLPPNLNAGKKTTCIEKNQSLGTVYFFHSACILNVLPKAGIVFGRLKSFEKN